MIGNLLQAVATDCPGRFELYFGIKNFSEEIVMVVGADGDEIIGWGGIVPVV